MNHAAFFPTFLGSYASYSEPDQFLIKLRETANLPCGWRFGKGIPPTKQAVTLARSIYQEFAFLRLKADVFPGADGSLSLVFYADKSSVELDISPEGDIDLYIGEGKGSDFQEIVNISDASIFDINNALLFIARKAHQWHFSGSFTQENLMSPSTALQVNASSTPMTGAASPWWTAIASSSSQNAPKSATT